MNRSRLILLLAWLLAGVAAAEKLDDFRIIGQRNIFNLHRSPRGRETSPMRPPAPRPVAGDSFTLVGTLAYETNQLAFFDGASPDCRRAVRPDETIAGYKLVAIGFNSVRLETQGQLIEMRVGMRLPRTAGSQAPLSSNGAPTTIEAPVASPVTAESSAPPTVSASPAADPGEILKKLMQRREQELR